MQYKTIKRFAKDFNLPIQLPDPENIEYFINLYDSTLDTRRKYNMFLGMVEKYGGEEGFFVESARIQNTIIDTMKEMEEYKTFIGQSMDTYNSVGHLNIPKGQVYKRASDGKWFMSVDLVKANFNAMKFFSKDLVLGAKTYAEFVSRYTEDVYFAESKKFRQVIFGNINPKRQQRIQRYIIDQLMVIMDKYIPVDRYKDITSDEVVIQLTDKDELKGSPMFAELEAKILELGVDVRFDVFQLKQFKPYDYYAREFIDGSVDFRCVPLNHYAEVFKHYFNMELTETDLMFYTSEQELAMFKSSLKFE